MNWFVFANSGLSSSDINRRLKKLVRESPFFQDLFTRYGVSIDQLDNLCFKIKELNGQHAKSNSNEIWLSRKLLDKDGFFNDGLHFVVHEMIHWLIRQREKTFYFADPEEIDAFSFGMLYELLRGKDKKQIYSTFFPIIREHFTKKPNAIRLFDVLFERAEKLKKNYEN